MEGQIGITEIFSLILEVIWWGLTALKSSYMFFVDLTENMTGNRLLSHFAVAGAYGLLSLLAYEGVLKKVTRVVLSFERMLESVDNIAHTGKMVFAILLFGTLIIFLTLNVNVVEFGKEDGKYIARVGETQEENQGSNQISREIPQEKFTPMKEEKKDRGNGFLTPNPQHRPQGR